MTKLSVNVNKIALLRNSRSGEIPDPVKFSRLALEAGAAGITVHPRPDERHIRPYDVQHLADLLSQSAHEGREFNIEGNPFIGRYMEICRHVVPDQCTLVPDAPGQATSDHGWDVAANLNRLKPVVEELHNLGCRVSLFMDPDVAAIERVPDAGADRIELYTEGYAKAHAQGGSEAKRALKRYADAAQAARDAGLGVNGGHDLNLDNLGAFVAIPGILEVSIGHGLVADALEMGMDAAVRAYLRVIEEHAARE
ncbi:MAG: pyridoxine 5'-phosphate synthase [Phycisphaeraceae bacterium]